MMSLSEKLALKEGFFSRMSSTDIEISNAERELQTAFSDEYKDYLIQLGSASYDGHELTGLCDNTTVNVVDVTRRAREYDPTIPSDFYVVENTHIDGIVAWQRADGSVYLSGDNRSFEKCADSIEKYLGL